MMLHRSLLALLAAAFIAAGAAAPGPPSAQPSFPTGISSKQVSELPQGLCWWPEKGRAGYAEYEHALIASASADRLKQWHELLAGEPHVAGTPGDAREIERIASAFRGMGLEVQVHDFWAYLCRPTAMVLEVMAPEHVALVLKEDILKDDPYSAHPELMPAWNAYSGNGDVTAPVVYANFGTKADFEKLAALHIDVSGKIVLARYGGNFRGYKAKFAEQAGAAGLIIYTDPADSGYCKGLLYPEGGYANPTCIQRGSILTLDYPGDPLTPFAEATEHASRLDPAAIGLPKIPVQPIGYASAQQIIGRMTGPAVPEGWSGGLPFPYRLTGGDELKVHLKVEQERFVAKTSNIVATLHGSKHPEQKVVLGCHHDAWGFGAADPLAGTITLMEAARCLSEAAKASPASAPERSIVFAAWGAEEFGIIGSTEWVEANRDDLVHNAVAYFNLDMAAMGPEFGSSASPSLQHVIADAAAVVPQAGTESQTVLQAWLARSPDPASPGRPKFGDLGGGSDHVGFLCYAGVPSAGLGAGGSQGTSYHSTYDNLTWYHKVVGDDYQPALMITRMEAAAASRLARAPILPVDFSRIGVDIPRVLKDMTKRGREIGFLPKDTAEIADDFTSLVQSARQYEETASRVGARLIGRIQTSAIEPAKADQINALLIQMDRAWLSDAGVPGRPWYKNLYAATDEDSGYGAWVLPLLRHAVEHKDADELGRAVGAYIGILSDLSTKVRTLDALLD